MLSAMRLFQFQADIKYRRQSSSLHTPFCVQSVFGINLFWAVRHRSLSHRVCRSRSVNGVHTGSNSPYISTNYFRAGCLQWKNRGCGRRTYTVMKARGWPYFIGSGGIALPVHSLRFQPYLFISMLCGWCWFYLCALCRYSPLLTQTPTHFGSQGARLRLGQIPPGRALNLQHINKWSAMPLPASHNGTIAAVWFSGTSPIERKPYLGLHQLDRDVSPCVRQGGCRECL